MLTGHKDTDKLVLENMDDKTLMNSMVSNKSLLKIGEGIFKERLKNNYPYLYEKKPFLESYRSYYLRMMYYLGKLREIFGVDYIPVPSFDPEGVYRGFKNVFTDDGKLTENFAKYHVQYLIPYYAELGDEEK